MVSFKDFSKRTFAVILAALALTVCCTACGNEQTPQESNSNPSVSDAKDKTSSDDSKTASEDSSTTSKEETSPESPVSDFEYKGTADGNGIMITKYTGTDSNVVIPKKINNKPVTIIGDITTLGEETFDENTSLTSVTIPDSVTLIDSCVFNDCTNLTNITIPDSVTSIGGSSFEGTAWYNNQPDGLVYVGKVAYKYKGDMSENTSIEIKNGTLGIAGNAFYSCKNLTNITIPDSVTFIGDNAFCYCENLASITIPDNITSIGYCAFEGTEWYNNQPDGLVYAGKVVYNYKGDMPKNTSIEIKNGTLGIAEDAFDHRTNLASITIPNSVISIGSDAFNNCENLASITIPDSVTSIGGSPLTFCESLTSIIVDEANNTYSSVDGVLFNKDKTTLISCPGGKAGEYAIPESVTSIGPSAFFNCKKLKSVIIPNSVKSIDVDAFGDTSFTSITIPDSVTSMFGDIFYDCDNLTEIRGKAGSTAEYYANSQNITFKAQ